MRFSTKLILSIIATTLIILLVFGFAVFLYTRDIVKNRIINEHLHLARYQIDSIDRLLHNAYQDIQLCGEDESLGQIFEPEQPLGQNTRKSIIKEMEERAILTGPWDLLMVVNKEGLIVFSPQKKYVGKNVREYPKTRAAFYPALEEQLYYSDLVLSEQTGRPTVIFSAPIRSEERERVAGVVIGHFAWPAIEEILDEMKPPTHAHLLNRDGLLIATSGIHRTETLSVKFAGHALVKKVFSGESWGPGMIVTMVEEDVEVLAGYVQEEGFLSYRGNGWGLLIETPTSAIFAPINRMAIYIVILAAIIIVILVILFNHIGRILTRPIESLNKTVKLFGAGDLSARVEVKTRDEIGNLAASFNDMAEDLETTTTSVDNLNREITERIKAEEQVRKQNEFLNTVLESLTHPFYVIDANDYTIKIANSALYPGKLPEKTTCYTLTHKRDKPCNGSDDPCPLEEIKKTKRPVVVEHVHYDKDGNPRNVEVHAYPILDDKGKVSEIIEYSLDITERKQAEEKLKQTAEEWITTFDSITDMVSIHDKDFKIVRANKAFANVFKMKPGEIIGKTCYELIHGTKEPPPFCPHKCTLDTGKPHRAEFFDPHLGIHVEASTSPIFDENGQVMASVHIAKDITERKQVECEIQDIAKFPSENPNPVLRVQKDGKILYGNDAALPLLAKWKKKVGGVVPAKWRRLIDKAFESKKAINDEEEVDGKIFSFVVAPILDGGYANMYAIDVTERKQAEVELKTAQEKLIDTAHRAGMAEVAADVLHNVGNVLNSINVSTTVIREKITSSEVANLEKVVGIINEHTDDLGKFLTEDPQGKHIPVYLTEVSKCLQNEQTDIISRLRALVENVQHIKDIIGMQQSYAKVSGAEVQTSISKLAEDAIQINSAGLERHGTRLIREFEELGDVEIDKQKVLQILVNLVSNAKYALSGSKREEKLLTIRIYKHGEDRFRIEVTDNGVGISEDNLTKIFSHGFTTKEYGHGFGLHSSALAAKEMGGSLTVYSDGLGQGATFTLGLPFKPVEVMK